MFWGLQERISQRQSDKEVIYENRMLVRHRIRQVSVLLPQVLSGLHFHHQRRIDEGRRPPSLSFFESSITNSSYKLGRGVFGPIWCIWDCHGTMEKLFQVPEQ